MTIGRRSAVSSLALTLIGVRALLAGQIDQSPSQHKSPRLPPGIVPPELIPVPKADPRQALQLQENVKNLRRDVDQLVQLAQDLKAEADKTIQTGALSVPLIHKADEVEKLAKQIKSLAHMS